MTRPGMYATFVTAVASITQTPMYELVYLSSSAHAVSPELGVSSSHIAHHLHIAVPVGVVVAPSVVKVDPMMITEPWPASRLRAAGLTDFSFHTRLVNVFSERVQSRAEQRDATRNRVLASADSLFRSVGFAATTIRDIARDAGVSTGTVMAVGDKGGLLVSVFDEWIASVHAERRATASSDTPLRPDQMLDAVMDLFAPFLGYFAQDPALSRAYAAIIVSGDRESAIFQELASSLVTEIAMVLSRFGLSADEAGRGARVIYFAYLGIVMTPGNAAVDGDSTLDQLGDVILYVIDRPEREA